MCIFTGEVHVANTRIYAATDSTGANQVIVYQMEAAMSRPQAMILPVPAKADDVELLDLSEAKDFFDKLDKLFPVVRSRGFGMAADTLSLNALEVHEIGDYQVSVAPNLAAVRLINRKVFTVPNNLKKTLARAYGEGFCFVVAQLREDGEIHPLGYRHPVPSPAKMFIPTRHEHGDRRGTLPRWDHEIYYPGRYSKITTEPGNGTHKHLEAGGFDTGGLRRFLEVLPEVLEPFFSAERSLHKQTYQGRLHNYDLWVRV